MARPHPGGENSLKWNFALSSPEPTPYPSQEGNYFAAASGRAPSWEGPGVGRFMGSFDLQNRTRLGAMN
jgi:hypothetical protein